jgi:hypothetical protein
VQEPSFPRPLVGGRFEKFTFDFPAAVFVLGALKKPRTNE